MKHRILLGSRAALSIILCVCTLILVACGGGDKKEETPPEPTPSAKTEPETAAAAAEKFSDWIDFTTDTDGFQIYTPKSFTISREKTQTEAGEIEVTTYLAEMPTAAYGVTCNDFDESLVTGKDPEILIRGGAKGFVSHLNGTVISEKMISLGESKGMELVLTGSSQGVALYSKGRLYLVKNKMYQIFVVAEQGKEDAEAIDKFIDSFKVK